MKQPVILRSKSLRDSVSIELPYSKSMANRILLMEALSLGKVTSPDRCEAEDCLWLSKALRKRSGELWMGEGAAPMRFALAWAALSPGKRVITGSERLCQRPMAPLVEALRQVGAEIHCPGVEGYAPFEVAGRELQSRVLEIDASRSSQYCSALMLIAPYIAGGLEIHLKGRVASQAYLELTARLMRMAGAGVTANFDSGRIQVAEGGYMPIEIALERDWSGAAFFYTLAALSPGMRIQLPGLSPKSLQGDAVCASLYRALGVQSHFERGSTFIEGDGATGHKVEEDFSNCPDLALPFATACAGLKIPAHLSGLHTLPFKESNRIDDLVTELESCGVSCSHDEAHIGLDSFKEVEGYPLIRTYKDHRMAMAFAPMARVFGQIGIDDAAVVAKSFPHFWKEMEKVFELWYPA